MPSVLRAGVPLVLLVALAVTLPSPAPSAPADARDLARERARELASCADGRGGRWIAEKALERDEAELCLVHVGLDGARGGAVPVRRTDAGRALAAELRCDGQGGAWLAWTELDYVALSTEVRAAHVAAGGGLLVRGDAVLASFFDLFDAVSLLADGRGGAYVAWREADANHDRRVRVCRLAADGGAASGWPANGLTLDEPRGNVRPRLVTDGEGGAIVVADADPNRVGGSAFALRVSPDAALLR